MENALTRSVGHGLRVGEQQIEQHRIVEQRLVVLTALESLKKRSWWT